MCERVTGHDPKAWSAKFRQRKRTGYESGDFYGGRIVIIGSNKPHAPNQPEVDGYVRRYGLSEPDDLICVKMLTDHIIDRRRDYVVPVHDGKFAKYDIVMMVNPDKYPR